VGGGLPIADEARQCTLHWSTARAEGRKSDLSDNRAESRLTVRLSAETLAKLDQTAAERGLSRSGALRVLLEGDLPQPAPADHSEALLLLAESARSGSVPARIALERALRRANADDRVEAKVDELRARRRAREEPA
jgi:Ribbon-helix-helix protein, copG family